MQSAAECDIAVCVGDIAVCVGDIAVCVVVCCHDHPVYKQCMFLCMCCPLLVLVALPLSLELPVINCVYPC